jgi:hypothetical protein
MEPNVRDIGSSATLSGEECSVSRRAREVHPKLAPIAFCIRENLRIRTAIERGMTAAGGDRTEAATR